MKKSSFSLRVVANNFLKVIALLSLTVIICIGCGGGGSDDEDGDSSNVTMHEVTTKASQILPDDELSIIEDVFDDATAQELESLDNAIDSFLESVEAHQEEENLLTSNASSGSGSSSRSAFEVTNDIFLDTKLMLNDTFGNINSREDAKRAFLNAGIGFNREVFGGLGNSITGAFITGGTFSLEGGIGAGVAYDFLNFSKYNYINEYCAINGGKVFGVEGSAGGDVISIIADGFMFGFQKNEEYRGGPAIGKNESLGLSGDIIKGIGISIASGNWIGLNDSCDPNACMDLSIPTGEYTDKFGFSIAQKVSFSVGASIGVSLNLSNGDSYSCTRSILAVQKYFNETSQSRIKRIIAGFVMASDLMMCNGGPTGSALAPPAAGIAILYGIYYDEDLVDDPSVNETIWYIDSDGDGYGDPNDSLQSTTQPSGYVAKNTDCDDSNAAIYPGATEICDDEIDNDCDDIIDEGCSSEARFTDMGDGTVRDNNTNLIWLKNASCFGYTNWQGAMNNAAALSNSDCGLTDGSADGDWRLPTKAELQGIGTDPSTTWVSGYPSATWTMPETPFTGMQSGTNPSYWSSTEVDSEDAWRVYMGTGDSNYFQKSDVNWVWAVRDN
jgi:Protein of unknown function (DUF1566)/Putative metal-binding motif